MKDLFSDVSALYQQARPSYPHTVIQEILKHVSHHHFAWDCGAGSGQFTQLLVPYFEQIVATDLSCQQLHQAPYFENVSYQVQQAEKTSFHDQSFDLITVAQAIHWFDFDSFYAEVKRTLKKDGVLAVIGYGLIEANDAQLNQHIQHIYTQLLSGYWDTERKHIDDAYQSIPFPFEEFSSSALEMQFSWSKEQLVSYLNTWTGLKHYREKNADAEKDPLSNLVAYLAQSDELIQIRFPIFLRIGKLKLTKKKKKLSKTKLQMSEVLKRVSVGFKAFVVA